jgi:hypothetical protein
MMLLLYSSSRACPIVTQGGVFEYPVSRLRGRAEADFHVAIITDYERLTLRSPTTCA